MDQGPFRMPQSSSGGNTNRPDEESHEEEASVKQTHRPTHRPTTHRYNTKEEKSNKRFIIPGVITVSVIVVAVVGWFVWSGMQTAGTGIDSGKYQAVFLVNGQTYFGKLHPFNDEYMKLTDVYYLQTQQAEEQSSKNPQQTSDDQNNVQLIKLGDEIHGPQDEMIIDKRQVLFYENLKTDGKVSQSIKNYLDKK